MAVAMSTSFSMANLRAPTARVQRQQQRRSLAVRATNEPEKPTEPATPAPEIPAMDAAAKAALGAPATPTWARPDTSKSLGDLMAFSGPAPELINGRLAMLAFVAALGAELSTGQTVLTQLAEEPTGVVLAAVAFATASLIPMLASSKREAFGPFTPSAEMLNGRAAMIGFASLLIVEGVRGAALF